MQALSFAVHIPLVCFGIAFPALVLFVEWLLPAHRRPALPHARPALVEGDARAVRGRRRHRARSSASSSACSGRTSWRRSATSSGSASRSRASRSSSRRSSSRIYVYGWDRLSPRMHFLSGIPIVITGFTGSLMVIAVNALDEPPDRLPARGRPGRSTSTRSTALFGNCYFWHELVHMYLAGYIVAGLPRRRRLRLGLAARPRAAATSAPRWSIPLTVAALAAPVQVVVGDWAAREVADEQPIKLAAFEGLGDDDQGRADPRRSAGTTDGEVKYGIEIPRLLSLLAFHDPNATVQGLDAVPGRTTGRRSTSSASRSRRWSGSGRCSRCSRVVLPLVLAAAPAAAAVALVLPRGRRRRAAVGRRADRRLGDDRGRPPAVGRLRRDAHGGGGDRGERHPGRLRDARRRLRRPRCRGRLGPAPARPRAARAAAPHAPPSARAAMALADVPARPHPRRPHRLRGARRRRLRRRALAAAGRPGERGARLRDTPTTRWGRSGRPTTSG